MDCDTNPDQPSNGLSYDEHTDEFRSILEHSSNMTRSLFGKQVLSHADSASSRDTASLRRLEIIKKIRARDQYGDLVTKLVKPTHPLSRQVEPIVRNPQAKSGVLSITGPESKQNVPPELSVILRESGKSIGQTRIEEAAKSARALVTPWLNAIDKRSSAMEKMIQPEWHPPWKLYRMISGHSGWVHSLAVDPSNQWFASGSRDGLIKIWDIASGRLRITFTGHISGVRGLAISDRQPYLFSCAEDKTVKCWDLEQNQVVRHYHGHLSGVYCVSLHPTENIVVTGGRDSVARVWDMRTKEQIHCLTGHNDTVGAIICQDKDPQIITGSYDTTMRMWDFKMAKCLKTLTNHKKSVRSMTFNYDMNAFCSGAADNIKQWSLPDGEFIQNLSGHDSIINSVAANKHNVLVSGADNGTLFFWDWRTGYNFQRLASPAQRGSIESEAGILAMTFDKTGARLITGESDKTIKMFREDPNATPESHPINWKPDMMKRSRF